MKRQTRVLFLLLGLWSTAVADIPADRRCVSDVIIPHGGGGATGSCSIVYYNLCSGWIWVWSAGWMLGDLVGVTFDLPNDCGTLPGEICENTGFWWYWRYTYPGYGYTMAYYLYEVDSSSCLVGTPLGMLTGQDPIERWNFYPGFGAASSDLVGIVATWERGSIPEVVTDATAQNHSAGCAPIPEVIHSWYFGNDYYVYCPPILFEDGAGPCNILMDATFTCETTATEPTSWGAVKSLFR